MFEVLPRATSRCCLDEEEKANEKDSRREWDPRCADTATSGRQRDPSHLDGSGLQAESSIGLLLTFPLDQLVNQSACLANCNPCWLFRGSPTSRREVRLRKSRFNGNNYQQEAFLWEMQARCLMQSVIERIGLQASKQVKLKVYSIQGRTRPAEIL